MVQSRPAKIRGTHRYSFRSGEWGWILGVEMVTPKSLNERACFKVVYEDGFVDYMPVKDSTNTYEIDG